MHISTFWMYIIIQDELYFFINTGEAYDFRFSFDPVTGEVGELILSY